MARWLRRPFSLALGALATTALGGCYYGDMTSAGYGGNYACAADYYDYDPYAYDDGYGYDCYDSSDYGSGFVSIGFGGGWYDDYYYPGYGMWMYDHYRNRYPLSGRYLGYWGGRRAWWKHRGDRDGHWNSGKGDGPRHEGRPSRPNRPDRPHRPGKWNGHDRDHDGPRGHAPRPGDGANQAPPAASHPGTPGRGPGATRPRPTPPAAGSGGRRPGTQPLRPRRPDPSSRPAAGNHRPPVTRPAARPAPTARPAPARPAPRAAPARPAPRSDRAARIRATRDE